MRLFGNRKSNHLVEFTRQLVVSICFLILLSSPAFSQKNKFRIHITDNLGTTNSRTEYTVTNDSLIISGIGDHGRSKVNYLQRKLKKGERRELLKFLKTFPIDSLDDTYKNEFNVYDYPEDDFQPRKIEIDFKNRDNYHPFLISNCYVYKAASLFDELNKIIPAEVQIQYLKAKFNAFY